MSARSTQGESGTRGRTARNDGVYSFDGGGAADGSKTETQSTAAVPGEPQLISSLPEPKVSWFKPVTSTEVQAECKDGICPVPWATAPAAQDWTFDEESQPDLVNSPPHYLYGGIECIEAIEAQLTPEEYRGYLKGNCVKYLWRERQKGGVESLKKGQWYMERLIAFDEKL